MWKRLLLLGIPVSLAYLASAAQAMMRTDYDPVEKKWFTYDTKDLGYRRGGSSAVPRKLINYRGPFGPETIVINTDERRLYYIYAKGKAIKYGIGVGREGFQWSGTDAVSSKAKWPGWTPPPEMIAREKAKGRILPRHMAGGLSNPLGARALYIGASMYRIHGSNEPWTIGYAVSSGCIRMTNQDVIDLYDRVTVGTRVVVLLSTRPQTDAVVASTGSEYKVHPPKAPPKAPLVVNSPASPAVAVEAQARPVYGCEYPTGTRAGGAFPCPRPPRKPVVVEALRKPAIEADPPVADAMPAAAPPQQPDWPAIEIRAISASISGASAAAETRATIKEKKPLPVPEARKDEPVHTSAGTKAPAEDDISGEGRS